MTALLLCGCYKMAMIGEDNVDADPSTLDSSDTDVDSDADTDSDSDSDADTDSDSDADTDSGSDTDTDTDTDTETEERPVISCEGNATWFDEASGLCWECRSWKCWDGSTLPDEPTDDNAFEYCEKLSLGGYTDWRLSNIGELRTLVRDCPATESDGDCQVYHGDSVENWNETCMGCELGNGPGLHGTYWDAMLGSPPVWACSSSLFSFGGNYLWCISFHSGQIYYIETVSPPKRGVRCVRNGLVGT
jgi:uncharacterized protein DUF1566